MRVCVFISIRGQVGWIEESIDNTRMVLKVGSGEIDDLSTLNVLDEESLLRELRARYKKGIIYVRKIVLNFEKKKHISYLNRLILEMF